MNRVLGTSLIGILGIAGAIAFGSQSRWHAEPIEAAPVSGVVAADPVLVAFSDVPDDLDGAAFERVMQKAIAAEWKERDFGALVQNVAEQFLGAEYVDGMLDRAESEELVLSLTKFDCVLFVETVLAMARSIVAQDYTYAGFGDRVETQRYRGGDRDDYCSRLHYFSEWIDDNRKRGYLASGVTDLTSQSLDKTLNFMTENRSKYARLASNDANFQCISQMEANLRSLDLQYVPTANVRNQYSAIQAGDVIAIATEISGIDVTHSGLAYAQPDGSMGFIHAAPGIGAIVAEDLQTYVERVPSAIGIVVARPHAGG
ncbi:MAG: N-acetylmuramoyl-L-alanine amidase-like domain-containing protein [Cyanobacteria bacterium J06639_1]